jgi:hypothetical protein
MTMVVLLVLTAWIVLAVIAASLIGMRQSD